MERLSFNIENLDCAACAAKIEKAIYALPEIDEVLLDFSAGRLHLQVAEDLDQEQLIPKLNNIINSVEEKVYVTAKAKTAPGAKTENQEQGKHHGHDVSLRADKHKFIRRQSFPLLKALRFILGLIPFIAALFVRKNMPQISLALFVIAWLLFGYDVVLKAIRRLFSGQLFDENFLMSLATVGALFIGEYPEAVAVMLFYQLGEIFQSMAVNHSRASIKALGNLRPDFASRLIGGNKNKIERISPSEANIGDLLLVKPGERLPLDGLVVEGDSELDTAALTGESLPVPVGPGDEVQAGSINGTGLLIIEASKPYEESAINRIMHMVEQAAARKSKAEQFITRFAAWYTPLMTIAALVIALVPALLTDRVFYPWIYKAMILLVISCPCALVLSVPLTYFAGMGAASSQGLLVKGGQYLDRLAQANQIVFDKTGTLTSGEFQVQDIEAAATYTKNQVLALAALLEGPSSHPIADSIKKAAKTAGLSSDDYNEKLKNYNDRPGFGVEAEIDGITYRLGNERMLAEIVVPAGEPAMLSNEPEHKGQYIWLLEGTKIIGKIMLFDKIKPEAIKAVQTLRDKDFTYIGVLTGDRAEIAAQVSDELKLDGVKAELMPEDKVAYLEKIMTYGQLDKATEKVAKGERITAYVGDGVNDAPVLARADLGIAIGSATDAAVESADIVVMGTDLTKISSGVLLARKTATIVKQNIALTLGLKILIMLLALVGLGGIWQAVFADVGVSLLAVLNSLRLLKKNAF